MDSTWDLKSAILDLENLTRQPDIDRLAACAQKLKQIAQEDYDYSE
jgi:hypothetical protein